MAYSVLTRIVRELGFAPLTGEAIGSDSLFFSLEDITLVGYDFLGDLFQKAGFSDADVILISAPYTANVFMLPKVIWCLRSLNPAPIILGGNEASNNYRNLMEYRFNTFANQTVDVSADFIVRGSAEGSLHSLLPLIGKATMTQEWDRELIMKFLGIPNLVFWLPGRKALISTEFTPAELREKDIFSYVRYGDKTIAMTLQRACVWAKESQGGCLFCAIASQFGKTFHCAVQSDHFLEELGEVLKNNPEVQYVDIWDDTFNISEEWSVKICDCLQRLRKKLGREIIYSCFLRPKRLTESLLRKMADTNFRVAFIGVDALTEDLSKRMRRGCTVAEVNRSMEALAKSKIQPRLSVQLFSPESTIDDGGITAALALSCIRNGSSTVHVHLYTFPLFGSDIYRLLNGRDNLKTIPTPLLKKEDSGDFKPYLLAFDYACFDPDVEEIKQRTYALLGASTSFHVRTYPGDQVDAHRLKQVLQQVRVWFAEEK
ncbi:MAG TPA: radical SAM protein, partial [Thermodesulfobacteriota bacterium]|nr:radical SAM protein [Thermodesulfobacteriota bacterium]